MKNVTSNFTCHRQLKTKMTLTGRRRNMEQNQKKQRDSQHGTKSNVTKRQSDLPLVTILHDSSVLNGVQGKRLR